MLPEVDIVITSSGAPHYILHKDEMQRVIAARRNKPMFLIDIAVPRNIEPAVNELDNIFLYDIDDLQEVVNANLRERMKEAEHAEALVAEEVERMMARLKVAEVTPTIVSLQEQLEQIRAGEIEKVRRKLGPLHARSRKRRIEAHDPRHHQQDRARAHLRAAQPRRPARRRARHRGHPKGVSPPGLIHAGHRIARFAARTVAGPLGAARNSPPRGHECRIEIIKTTGDKITDVPLAKVGTKGLFTKEIEEALLDGRADLAVHSLKDLPTELPEGLVLAAVPEREDPRDAMVGRRLADLPQGAKVGTSSLRRAAQLRKLRPDLEVESVRGNLDTRLRKLDEGQYDAILLAAAGLKRLGWADRIAEILPAGRDVPRRGPGRAGHRDARDGAGFDACARWITPTRTPPSPAERGVLGALGGGCQVPIGAHATVPDGASALHGRRGRRPTARELIRAESEGAVRGRRKRSAAALGRGPAGPRRAQDSARRCYSASERGSSPA